ncbi:MAG TPA: hypothetical protein VFU47_02625 [Armatimonadota bacterium]|nr:hypothetical protein [Armatimonadota bacterium]
MRKPGDVKLTVILTNEEMIVNRAVYAGVDGPVFSEPLPGDLARVDDILRAEGYERTTDWKTGRAYYGLYLEAELIERR